MRSFLVKTGIIFLASFFLVGCVNLFSSEKIKIDLTKDNTKVSAKNLIEEKNLGIKESKKELNQDSIGENGRDRKMLVTEKNSEKNNISEDDLKNILDDKFEIKNKFVTWGFSKVENRKIDTIIIHSSYNAVGNDPHDLDDIIYKEYKLYGVSPHYIISYEGTIYRLVEDKNIAYHAGESKIPDGRTGVNNFSIGIEIINTKSEKPSDVQYGALKNLLAYLKGKYKIKYILGHSDIASGRKDDPWNFDFSRIK